MFQSDLHLFMRDHIVDFVTARLHISSSTGRSSRYHPVNNSNSLLSKRHAPRRKEVNNPLISEAGRDFLCECCAFVTVFLFCRSAAGVQLVWTAAKCRYPRLNAAVIRCLRCGSFAVSAARISPIALRHSCGPVEGQSVRRYCTAPNFRSEPRHLSHRLLLS